MENKKEKEKNSLIKKEFLTSGLKQNSEMKITESNVLKIRKKSFIIFGIQENETKE